MIFYHVVGEANAPAEYTTTPGTGSLQLVQAQQVNNQHRHLWWALISGPNQILILPLTETAVGGEVKVIPWDLKLTSAQIRAATWSQPLLVCPSHSSAELRPHTSLMAVI